MSILKFEAMMMVLGFLMLTLISSPLGPSLSQETQKGIKVVAFLLLIGGGIAQL